MTMKLLSNPKFSVYGLHRGTENRLIHKRKEAVIRTSVEAKNPFACYTVDIADKKYLQDAFREIQPDVVLHLAAEAGIRASSSDPESFTQSNLVGFANILEMCRTFKVKNLFFASSSSVYGNSGDEEVGSDVGDPTSDPISYYAATKKANEVMARSYSNLYQLNSIALRFFTVYGPLGRPDMATWKFTEKISDGDQIELYNHGEQFRSFTYIDDVVEMTEKLMMRQLESPQLNAVYNVGNPYSEYLPEFVQIISDCVGKDAIIKYLPPQLGDVWMTKCNPSWTESRIGEIQYTPLRDGISKFVEWYKDFVIISPKE